MLNSPTSPDTRQRHDGNTRAVQNSNVTYNESTTPNWYVVSENIALFVSAFVVSIIIVFELGLGSFLDSVFVAYSL